jgi:hypothetical protein
VKNEGGNLSTLAQTFNFVVICPPVALVVPWQGSRFGHAFNKACQDATNDAIVCSAF